MLPVGNIVFSSPNIPSQPVPFLSGSTAGREKLIKYKHCFSDLITCACIIYGPLLDHVNIRSLAHSHTCTPLHTLLCVPTLAHPLARAHPRTHSHTFHIHTTDSEHSRSNDRCISFNRIPILLQKQAFHRGLTKPKLQVMNTGSINYLRLGYRWILPLHSDSTPEKRQQCKDKGGKSPTCKIINHSVQ